VPSSGSARPLARRGRRAGHRTEPPRPDEKGRTGDNSRAAVVFSDKHDQRADHQATKQEDLGQ
jgi:hypothetical protein